MLMPADEGGCHLSPMELFLQDYSPQQDYFRDRVIAGMMAQDSVNGLITGITGRYGQPLWSTTSTSAEKSGNYLFVPITDTGCDSVSAVILFKQRLDTSGLIDYYIMNNSCPDTIITDFILHCQTSIYGKGYTPWRYTVPINPTKEFIYITKCWETYGMSNVNGSTVVTYNGSSCSTQVVNLETMSIDGSGGGIGYIDSGTIPDGGTGGNNTTNCSRAMTSNEMNAVENARNAILARDHCPTNKLIEATASGISYKVNPCMESNTYGTYNYSLGSIIFRNASEVTPARLYEETFHAYQDQFYTNGLAQYGPKKPGHTNMEFEAKLMQAIYCIEIGLTQEMNLGNAFRNEMKAFQEWITKFIYEGITNDFWEKYDHFIGLFEQKFPTYAGYNSSTFPRMEVINQLIEGCQH